LLTYLFAVLIQSFDDTMLKIMLCEKNNLMCDEKLTASLTLPHGTKLKPAINK